MRARHCFVAVHSNCPVPRSSSHLSAQLAVLGNTLWLFGGTVELGQKEITLDDLWRLDLVKLDGWSMVKGNSVGDELFNEQQQESSEWEDDEGND